MSERGVFTGAEDLRASRIRVEDDARGAGRTLGKYRIIGELGSGGMATVYLAVVRGPSGFSKLVVVKVLRSALGIDADAVSMFMDEARLAARLNHPNVVQTNEVGTEDGHHLLVMEYLDGVTLNEALDRQRRRGERLPLGMHLRIIHDALNGLHYAHELTDFNGSVLELVHRDISPHNLFVTFDGQVKVLDFGIAKVANSSHETRTGVIKGKIRYMSPEQLTGDSVDRRADIFAVGAMLWEAATGQRLWKGKTDVEIMSAVVNGTIPAPRDIQPEANETLDRICRKALSANREDRYANCLQLQSDLEELIEELGDRSNTRTLSRFLNESFEETRQERKRMIEARLSEASNSAPTDLTSVTVPALPGYSSSGSHSIDRAVKPADTGSGSRSIDVALDVPGSSRGKRWAVIVGLVALGAAAAIAIPLVFAHKNEPAPVASAATTSAQPEAPVATATASATATATPEATISVRAEPATATLFLDGTQLATNPFKRKFARDGATHVLRAEANGYVTKAMTVNADADREIVLTLDRAPAGHVGKPGHPAPVVTVTAPPPVATAAPPPPTETKPAASATGKKPPKSIDTVNPWD